MPTSGSTTTTSQPGIHEILREIGGARDEATFVLLRGQSGSGKSATLSAVREHLRARNIPIATDLSETTGRPYVLVVDDAHTLSEHEIAGIRRLVEESRASVIVATEPRPHDQAMRSLTDAVARRGRVFELRSLSTTEIGTLARELAIALPQKVVDATATITGGLRGAVLAALDSTRDRSRPTTPDTIGDAVARWAGTLLKARDAPLLQTLVLTATGVGLDVGEVADVVGVDRATAADLVDRARACGLVTDPDLLLPVAAAPLRNALGEREFLATQRRLLEARLETGALRAQTAFVLAESGIVDDRLAVFLRNQAEQTEPMRAAQMYDAAVHAGANRSNLAVRRAEVAALTGDFETAMALAQGVLAETDRPVADLATAVRITAGVWAHRGVLHRSAELYEWLGRERVGADGGIAAAILVAVGDSAGAAAMLNAPVSGPPTDFGGGVALLGTAMAQSISGAAAAAAGSIKRAVTMLEPSMAGPAARFLPVSPVTVAALLAVHTGDIARAEAILERRTADRPNNLNYDHHRLIAAWIAMQQGKDDEARQAVDDVDSDALDQRDRFVAQAIRVGLARRAGDHGALATAWNVATHLLDEITIDLFSVLALGELWLGAVRVGAAGKIAPFVADAERLLNRLDDPPIWAATFHWYGVQAAILADDPQALAPHARYLRDAAPDDPYSAILAAGGRVWLQVLAGKVDQDEVAQAAQSLRSVGLPWDGARLASEAALRAPDTASAATLLQVARSLRPAVGRREPAPAPGVAVDTPTTAATLLSDREGEVADLLVLGLTYREVGAQLYISAKTVEHHVARIRRRLGAGSRSELLSMLRAMGHGQGAARRAL